MMIEYKLEKSMRKTIAMTFRNKQLVVKAPFFVTKKSVDSFVKKNIHWINDQQEKLKESVLDESKIPQYKKDARAYIIPKVEWYAKKFGFSYNKIRITSATTRWGSCSSRKNLNFSYRLILTPAEMIDYVIVHELCHLRQMNHSHKFWAEVEAIMPDYK